MRVAIIPARVGSVRVPGKNTRLLGGIPLWKHTEAVAFESRLFDGVYICTDDPAILSDSCKKATVLSRSAESATADAPDIVWLREAVRLHDEWDAIMILRPTSPFRTVHTLTRAWTQFQAAHVHSLRAVEPVRQHPGKMWGLEGDLMHPLLVGYVDGVPWHSCQTQTLPVVYVQNASLEIVWADVVRKDHSLTGFLIAPFFTQGLEGFDINTEADFTEAERLIAQRRP